MDARIRMLRPGEAGCLEDFLYESIFVPEGEAPPDRSILDKPELRVYVDGFGEGPADVCFVAEDGEQPVGAAWSRIMDDYGQLDDETASLSVALYAPYRGRGLGGALLEALLGELKARGWRRASLSVQKRNRAQRLYRRLGFEEVVDKGEELLMARTL